MHRRLVPFVLALLGIAAEALAIPPQGSAPAPTTVEFRAVQTGPWRNPAAVLHALRRDTLEALSRCPVGTPAGRGAVAVTLERDAQGRWAITVGTPRRDLRGCITAAVARMAIPPREATPAPEDPPERVTFELLLGVAPARGPGSVLPLPGHGPAHRTPPPR